MDTMTLTKAGGALCATLLVFLLGLWAAESLYHVGVDGHGDEVAMGYAIEVAEAEDAAAAEDAEPEVPFADVFVNASAEAGAGLWRQCSACHNLEGNNATGPYLNGVVGRPIGAVEGYSYSGAMASYGGEWSPEELNGFLINPKEHIEGTKMAYRGMREIEDRANLIAYLATHEN